MPDPQQPTPEAPTPAPPEAPPADAQAAEVQPEPDASAVEAQRAADAVAFLEGAEQEAGETAAEEPTGDQPTEEPAAPEGDQPANMTELYARLTDLDRENRTLRQQAKAPEAGDLSSLIEQHGEDAVLEALTSRWDTAATQAPAADIPNLEGVEGLPPEVAQLLQTQHQQLQQVTSQLDEWRQAQEKQAQEQQQTQAVAAAAYTLANEQDATRWAVVDARKAKGALAYAVQIQAQLAQQGLPSSIEDALDAVEAEQLQSITDDMERLRQVPKLAHLFGAPTSNGQQQQPPAAPLTAAPQLSAAGEDTPAPQELTEEDRFKDAVRWLEEKEKSG